MEGESQEAELEESKKKWRVEGEWKDTMWIKEGEKAGGVCLLAEASVTLSGLLDPSGSKKKKKNQHVCSKRFH